MSEITDADFPVNWRYNPLRWVPSKKGKTGAWVNAIAYKSNKIFKGFGEFRGVDVNGVAHFEKDSIEGIPCVRDGIAAVAATPGMAVGIFVKHCDPGLVVVDCDSDVEFVEIEGGGRRLKVTLGRDQLIELFARRGEQVPYAPAIRGNRDGHGYLIFRQNRLVPIKTRKIRPYGLYLDVIGNGHQVHWSAPGSRALLQGAELLDNPPEVPLWFARFIKASKDVPEVNRPKSKGDGRGLVWEAAGVDLVAAILARVTPDGPAWNERLFKAACGLAEHTGLTVGEIRDLVLERCGPEDDDERQKAIASIHSAWRRVTGEDVQGA